MKHTELLFITILGIIGGLTSASDHVVKRSDDTNPFEAVVSRLTETVHKLQAEVESLKNAANNAAAKKVAFQAYLPTSTISANAPIHLTPLHQVGHGYDSTTGVFTVPFPGWYSVDFQLSPHDNADFYLDMYLNQGIAARAHCDENTGHPIPSTCNSGLTLHVNAGDKMWFQSSRAGAYWTSPFDNTFSIVLVTPDD